MKLIFVYDSNELKNLGRITPATINVEEVHILTIDEHGKNRFLYDVATDVKKETTLTENCIIFIHQYLKCTDVDFPFLYNNAGTALLKFIRIFGIKQHVILISPFKPIDLIQKNISNLILSTSGITFKRSLNEFSSKNQSDLELIAKEKFERDLLPFILAEFQLPENERHNWANWWGILQLTDVHRALFPHELKFVGNTSYPFRLNYLIKNLKNQQALALFKYKVNINDAITSLVAINNNKKINNLTTEIKKLNKQIYGAAIKSPQEEEWFDFIKVKNELIEIFNLSGTTKKNTLKEISIAQNKLEEGKIVLENKKREHVELLEIQDRIIGNGNNFKFTIEIQNLRFSDHISGQPKILHIDDKANEGWSEIFQIMIYGKNVDKTIYEIIHDVQNIDEEQLKRNIVDCVNSFKPDLVLLDLRLHNEIGTVNNVEELLGAIILKQLKEDFIGLPVLITTASNKVSSYQSLLRIGADAFWMKEGIDITASQSDDERAEYSINNYKDFIKKVHLLSSEKYKLLKYLGDFIILLKTEKPNKFWWENGRWIFPNGNEINANTLILTTEGQITDRETILNIISDSYYLLYIYLQQTILQQGFYKNYSEWFFPSLIIQQLGKIIEVIHGFENDRIFKLNDKDINVRLFRKDNFGNELYKIRNKTSHINNIIGVDFNVVKKYIEDCKKYLTEIPLIGGQTIRKQ